MNADDGRAHVVVGVDCTPASAGLLRWADRYAELIGATLIAVTGWRIDAPGIGLASTVAEVEHRTIEVLAQTVQEALPPHRALRATLRVLDTVPAEALLAESISADLVVVGPHSAHPIEGLLLGSVTEHVISEANCPVAIVRNPDLAPTGRIVVGLVGSECSGRALNWAITHAKLTGATVEAITAWEWTPHYGVYPYGPDKATVEKDAQRLLDLELARLPDKDRSMVSGQLREGHPAQVLLDASAGADALVVGNHRPGITTGRLLGSISQKVARHADVTVVIVHEHDYAITVSGHDAPQ